MVGHPLEKCIMLEECIVWLIEDGTIVLELHDKVETNHISCETKEFSLIQFERLEPTILYKHGLPSATTQRGFFLISVFDKLVVKMTSCSEVEEEAGEEDGRRENSLGETDKTMAALETMPMHLNWDKSLVYQMRCVSIWPQP